MSNSITLGGDRLGSGKKEKIHLKSYERSTHDLGYVWRSTMASGTLVPFMSELALPGDTFDIDLDCDIKTHPTVGPLFGSYKVQLDVFSCPIRLYNGKLHMNMLNIGMKMQDIKLPQIRMAVDYVGSERSFGDNDQINPSCIFSYLNIRGLGVPRSAEQILVRDFNAIPYLAYWDIYKQYYANKQEEVGAYIHNDMNLIINELEGCTYVDEGEITEILQRPLESDVYIHYTRFGEFRFQFQDDVVEGQEEGLWIAVDRDNDGDWEGYKLVDICESYEIQNNLVIFRNIEFRGLILTHNIWYDKGAVWNYEKPKVNFFPLQNIDQMREEILSAVGQSSPFIIDSDSKAPYGTPLLRGDNNKWSKQSTQEGLGLKTYQSDLFNNWISTEWIDGENGVNAITAVDTSEGYFTLDSLQLSRKVYDMLNRIAISGGSYDDWLNAVYTHERTRSIENPMYMGGLIKELAFQEVVSNAAATKEGFEQPLGTLAGRGVLTGKNKGGKIVVRVDEPSYIMGIISLTPRVDYSQGNKWDVNLKTMDDLHKPAMDEIGFQSLISDQLAWWDTKIVDGNLKFNEVGKQPAWINYMTNVNQVRGNFAEKNNQMFMTLNRRYENSGNSIKDLTTYIDPSKFNHIFADTRLDAQNFWAQIAVDITARRKMSAKVMPNL
jgi:hypothetical protein